MDSLTFNYDIDYETIDGKIYYMTPRPVPNHNTVIVNLTAIFRNYLKGKNCIVFSDGVDLHLDEKNNVIPDLMIICNRDMIKSNGVYGTPNLIIEVLSPTTAIRDKGHKKDLYERFGVKEYWLVDISNKSIEVYVLEENKYILEYIYTVFPNYILEKMTEDEKQKIITQYKTNIFPDLTISLEDVFYNVID